MDDLSKLGLDGISKVIDDIDAFLDKVPNTLKKCTGPAADYAILATDLVVLGNPVVLAARISFNLLTSPLKISGYISDCIKAFDKNDYERSGELLAKALKQIIAEIGGDDDDLKLKTAQPEFL